MNLRRKGGNKEMAYCITKQYMKYIAIGGVVLKVNKELEKGAKVVLMVPFLKTDDCGSYTAGYNVLFEKEEDEYEQKEPESKSNTSELKPCPFCGTKVKMRKVPLYAYSGCFEFDVRCSKCGCTLDFTQADSIYRSEEEAIANVTKKWNERKESK